MRHQEPLLRRGARGQALVLAALSLLLLALMMAFSFSLSHALREKTRLQQHSDALAYSMATLEARALNYFAVTNRSMAASYVAMNSAHAYMAAASGNSVIMHAGKQNFYRIGAYEAALCVTSFTHCEHALHAFVIARLFRYEARNHERKIRSVEPNFTALIQALDQMVDVIHQSQRVVLTSTLQAVKDGSSYGLHQLRQINAPEASLLESGIGALNAAEFACAIDGMPCTLPGKAPSTPRGRHALVMTEVANASRLKWPTRRREHFFPSYLTARARNQVVWLFQAPFPLSFTSSHRGSSKTVQWPGHHAAHGGWSDDNEGRTILGEEHGKLTSVWRHFLFSTHSYSVEISSNAYGGQHAPSAAHAGKHLFEGVNARELLECASEGNCFMKYRSDPDPKHDFGQPRVYSYVTGKLRMGSVDRAPWELNEAATLRFQHGEQEGTVRLAPDEGAAASKALVYYHRLGDWQEQPNMFNPFWRSKLHPFSPQEASQILSNAGHGDGAAIATTPYLPL